MTGAASWPGDLRVNLEGSGTLDRDRESAQTFKWFSGLLSVAAEQVEAEEVDSL
jgi:hypothetical protein